MNKSTFPNNHRIHSTTTQYHPILLRNVNVIASSERKRKSRSLPDIWKAQVMEARKDGRTISWKWYFGNSQNIDFIGKDAS